MTDHDRYQDVVELCHVNDRLVSDLVSFEDIHPFGLSRVTFATRQPSEFGSSVVVRVISVKLVMPSEVAHAIFKHRPVERCAAASVIADPQRVLS